MAGSAIVQGNATDKSVKQQTRGNSVKHRSAAYAGPAGKDLNSTAKQNYDPLLEGLLTSKQVGIVSSPGDHLEMTPGPMHAGNKGNTTLSVSGTMD